MTRLLILILLPLTLILTICTQSAKKGNLNNKEKVLQISLEFLQKTSENNNQVDNKYPAKITLTNISDSIITFWTMSCSWTDNWIFDRDSIGFYSLGCDSNIPQLISLKTSQSIEYKCVLNLYSNNIKQFRLGIVLLGQNDFGVYENKIDWRSFLQKHTIYWSNTIQIE